MENRDWVDGRVAEVFGGLSSATVIDRLTAAQTAYGNINSVHDLIEHPQLRTRRMAVGARAVEMPALPWVTEWDAAQYRPVPRLNEHGAALRDEFAAPVAAGAAR
jgi:crotonobetainyl-CoA:carnitine CoA-transferase CaiB-like acyl-CoA transferase